MNYREIEAFCSGIAAAGIVADLYFQACSAPANTLTGWSLEDRNPEIIDKLMPFLAWIYQYYFRVQTDGWEHIPKTGKVLLIGSHNGGLAAPDAIMMSYDWFRQFGSERQTYAVMDSKIWQFFPSLARLGTQIGTIRTYPKLAMAALRRDAAVLIYPGGAQDVFRPYCLRNRIHFTNHKAFVKLALQEEVAIIPFISYGAHSTLIVLADLYPQLQQIHQFGMPCSAAIDPRLPPVFPIYLGLPWGIAFGPWPNIPFPLELHTRVCPPIVFERYGQDAAHDREYVNRCYEQVVNLMQSQLDRLVEEKNSQRSKRSCF